VNILKAKICQPTPGGEMRPGIISLVGQQEIKRVDSVFTFNRQTLIEQMLKDGRWKKAAKCYKTTPSMIVF
jgi:hypothetical protein